MVSPNENECTDEVRNLYIYANKNSGINNHIHTPDVQQAYNSWAAQYDGNLNKTRDIEGVALRTVLAPFAFEHVLEIGCGTGKNTGWLAAKAKQVTAVDFSEEMLSKAKQKINAAHVDFVRADIMDNWLFVQQPCQLVSFSLVLEHIDNLDPIFEKTAKALAPDGLVYLGELHPFKQYAGSKARFPTGEGEQVLTCFNHHISDFTTAAMNNGLQLVQLTEHFDDDDRTSTPRILTMLFRKPAQAQEQ